MVACHLARLNMIMVRPISILRTLTKRLRRGVGTSRVVRNVALPGFFLQWLGFDAQELATVCKQNALQTFSYVDIDASHSLHHDPATLACPAELQDAVTYAACVATDSLPAELDATHIPVRQQWQEKITANFARVLEQFRKQRPDVVLLVQGFEPCNAVARCAAFRLDIPLIALENTAIANRMVWDNVSGITTNRSIAKNYYWRYKDRHSAATCDAYCEQLIHNTKQLKSDEHHSPSTARHLASDRPMLLFLGQVYTDSSQVFGLRQWNSPLAVLHSCVQWCREHQHDLVVKLHPKETTGNNTIDDRPYDRLTYRKIMEDTPLASALQELGALIDEDNSYDTYDLINRCTAAVTVNSQAGLEAAIRGKPVVVCGEAFYGGLDFTWDAPSPVYFDSAVQAAVRSGPAGTAVARQFAYTFFEHHCRPKNVHALLQLLKENF